jgi:lantibiotic modifying enzyme
MSSSPPTWAPLLEGEDAARAAAAVTAIAEAIGEAPLPARNSGAHLAGGEAGVALLFAYLDRAHPGAGYGEIALQRVERSIDALAASTQTPSLYAGFTGVSWVAEHLQDASADEDDLGADIDAALLHHLRQTPWEHHFDLISGLAGYGVYALERLPRPAAAACLELVVERLAEIAQPRPGGLAWFTSPHLLDEQALPWSPQGYDNLGVAHGIPGVIAVLAGIATSGVAAERARALLAGAVPWLLAQKLPAGERSVFPYGVGNLEVRPSRAAWCYGDPGIALALLAAGRAMGEPTWEEEALALARAVARRSPETCGVRDAGLCHGAAGLGHLLNRLSQATGDPEIQAAARDWFSRTLAYWQPDRGIGGFLFMAVEADLEELVWTADAGFLIGSAGVALALLAAVSGVEPAWDRLLVASSRHCDGAIGRPSRK